MVEGSPASAFDAPFARYPRPHMGGRRRILEILVALVATLGGVAAQSSVAAAADIGFERSSTYAPLTGPATGTKPESKLWFADGTWWATMFQGSTHRIFRLNRSFQTWGDTGTVLDDRRDTRADTLWDGASNKLYVASHVWSGDKTGESATTAERGAKLWRFSYDPGADSYTRDPGFPVNINQAESETLTIDRDSTGTLWATWVQGSQVFVNRATGDGQSWGTPFVLPGSTTNLDNDDISSLVHFGGDRIGLMFDNETDHNTYFAVHQDGAPDAAWSIATVPTGWNSDDHINLKADSAGRVFAVTKTSDTSSSQPLILLNVRATTGAWSTHVVGRYSDGFTRPIVQLDEQNARVHVVMTCGSTGGSICEKTSPLGVISFGGAATTIIRDDSAPGELNDVTSTKQNVNGATGLVVMASQEAARTYWHTDLGLGGAPPPLSADFTVSPGGGTAPVAVTFSDGSSGSPTSWRWDFGDGTSSTQRNPTHTYGVAGSYTVTLTAANGSGSDTRTRVGAVTVAAPGGETAPGGGTPPGSGAGGSGSGAGGSASGSGSGAVGIVTPRPGGGVLGEIALGRSISVGLRATRLSGGRVRLSGSVSVRLSRVKASLQRRSSTGRWTTLHRTTLLPLAGGKSRYAFVIGRPSRTTRYRIVLPSSANRTRAISRSLQLTGTRSLRRTTARG